MIRRLFSYVVVIVITTILTTIFQPFANLPTLAQTGCHTFLETGKTVCGQFLVYWQSHGGLAQQGYPISSEFVEVSDLNGKSYIVQYFERAVFELHPENPPPYNVLLSQLGTFQFKRKYPNGEPGAPPPTAQPAPTQPPAQRGPKLEIQSYRAYNDSSNDLQIVGVAINSGSAQLGRVKIIAVVKDVGGRIVGTGTTDGPGGMMPNDFWPFRMYVSPTPASYASIEFQIDAPEATDVDKSYYYRDFQVNDINVLPPGTYGGVSVVGTVKNVGTQTAQFTDVFVAGLDSAGKVVAADDNYADINTLAPGQSTTFKVELSGARSVSSVKVAAYASRK